LPTAAALLVPAKAKKTTNNIRAQDWVIVRYWRRKDTIRLEIAHKKDLGWRPNTWGGFRELRSMHMPLLCFEVVSHAEGPSTVCPTGAHCGWSSWDYSPWVIAWWMASLDGQEVRVPASLVKTKDWLRKMEDYDGRMEPLGQMTALPKPLPPRPPEWTKVEIQYFRRCSGKEGAPVGISKVLWWESCLLSYWQTPPCC